MKKANIDVDFFRNQNMKKQKKGVSPSRVYRLNINMTNEIGK